jgi:leucyl aminopeptidase
MPGGHATRPGDIVKSLDGKTVEINNTDAEGRLTLADAITFAAREGADEIVDIATLTGACVIALGRDISGLMSNDKDLANRLIKAGDEAGEKLWELPLHPDYKDALKSDVADMKNTGGREGATIAAGLFIQEFAQGKPWAHIDIAGPSTIEKDTILAPKGSTGVGVRLFVNYVMQY